MGIFLPSPELALGERPSCLRKRAYHLCNPQLSLRPEFVNKINTIGGSETIAPTPLSMGIISAIAVVARSRFWDGLIFLILFFQTFQGVSVLQLQGVCNLFFSRGERGFGRGGSVGTQAPDGGTHPP